MPCRADTVQLATESSDSTTLRRAISRRTGPCTAPAPKDRPPTRDSLSVWLAAPPMINQTARRLRRRPGSMRPGRIKPSLACQHRVRTDSIGKQRLSIQPGRWPLQPTSKTRICEIGLHEQQRAATGQALRRRRAQWVRDKSVRRFGNPTPVPGPMIGRS